ncbi:MAG: alanine racemase [Deltaproteobacteria bacterium HGW-Deltaproteobacteria-21]|nr:MAG: alanine racemase [Deltaproteobacteria bacterium HGW-Deltaproteobacteria-21]
MIESPNRVKIDLSSLVKNLELVKGFLGPETKIMGIVKSDAYGHGLVPVAKVLEAKGIYSLGVAHPEEGVALRKSGIQCPVVILCGIRSRDDAAEALARRLTPVIFDREAVELLSAECMKRGKKIGVHLKVDTGMNRLGVPSEKVAGFMRRLTDFTMLEVRGLTSHLSSADEPNPEFTEMQIERFEKAVNEGLSMGFRLNFNNLANSAGVIRYKRSHFNMVRPGIMLYGGLPSPDFPDPPPLAPVMLFCGKVLQVRDLPSDTPVGYGRTYYTTGAQKVAVLSAGYGDGLPRSLSNKGAVLIRSRRCRLLGTVCMNMAVCDVTGMEGVAVGDEAVFLGTTGGEAITGDDLARWGNTISYEVFCSIGQRHIREYS